MTVEILVGAIEDVSVGLFNNKLGWNDCGSNGKRVGFKTIFGVTVGTLDGLLVGVLGIIVG